MICPKCNEEIADKAKFCTKWGANIEEVTKELETQKIEETKREEETRKAEELAGKEAEELKII